MDSSKQHGTTCHENVIPQPDSGQVMFLSLTLIQSKKVWPWPGRGAETWPRGNIPTTELLALVQVLTWKDFCCKNPVVLLVGCADSILGKFHHNFIWISLKKGFQKTIRYRNQSALGLNFRSNFENSDSPKNAWAEKAHMLNLHNSWTQNQKNLWRLWKLETLSSSFLCNSRATSTELYLECINHVWSFLTQQGGQIAAVFVKAL